MMWAVIRVDDPATGTSRWIVRKGCVMHRELRRIALSFEGELYHWFRPGEDLFASPAEAGEQAARFNRSPPETETAPEPHGEKP